MTKHDFFEKLNYELGNMDGNTKTEILNDFREHFEVAERAGKSEEEICRILGDPREIAVDFTHDTGGAPHLQMKERRDYGHHEEHSSGTFIQRLNANGIIKVQVININSDIEVHGEDTDIINVEIDDDDARYFTATVAPGGVFIIKETRRRSTHLTLTLPVSYEGTLEIGTSSGDVDVDGLENLRSMNIKTGSGDLGAHNIGSGGISLSTGSGDIELTSCVALEGFNVSTGSGDVVSEEGEGNFNVSTGSGDISVEGHRGTVRASAGSGCIEVSTDEITGDISYSTGSGEIEVSCERLSGNIRMSSGSGDINFQAREVHGDISAKTASGSIELGLGAESDVKFKLTRVGRGGSVTNAFDEIAAYDPQRGVHYTNRDNARYMVKCETVSGDIEVNAI
ncbi:MAG: DUF4097 family beta strand repeat-containing protein [Defluviitaleaceae bacterium]|nr:DUF4097 family beta strand repeat-containing protein [Defluviitaleaceae bacterium]MCL2836466.1 DUF4097 family beta strand repeat-containing protein [Defluviitaleaceae bacterium]